MAAAASSTSHATLTPIQEQVVAMMAAGVPIRDIAREAEIHRNTIGNWRRTNPAFAAALANAQHDRILYWREEAEAHAHLAIATLGHLIADRKTPASVRLRAALAVLEYATKPLPAPPPEPATPADPSEATHIPSPAPARPVVHSPKPPNVHKVAQMPNPVPSPAASPSAPPRAKRSKALS